MQCAVLTVLVAFGLAACGTDGSPARPPQLAAGSGSGVHTETCPAIAPPAGCTSARCPKGTNCYPYVYCGGGGMLWCCDDRPSCDPGDRELDQSSCPGNIPCYQQTLCGTQIACLDTKRAMQEDAGAEQQ